MLLFNTHDNTKENQAYVSRTQLISGVKLLMGGMQWEK